MVKGGRHATHRNYLQMLIKDRSTMNKPGSIAYHGVQGSTGMGWYSTKNGLGVPWGQYRPIYHTISSMTI